MPLSKARDKARKRIQRAQKMLGVVQPKLYLNPVQPINPSVSSDSVNAMTDVPFYDPLIHKAGDKVWIWRLGKQVKITVP